MRNLCITITFVEGKPRHHVSYKHHQSHRWHQLGCPIRPTLSPAFSLYPLRPYYATWHATYAQAWSSYHQTTQPAQRSLHSQLPQRWLRYWSYPGVQSSQAAGKETKNVVPHKHCQAFWLWASGQIPGGIPRGPPGSRCHFRVVRLEGGHPPFGHVGLRQRGEAKSRLVQRQPLDHGAPFWGQTTSPLEHQKEPFEKTLTTLSAARNATQSTARR